MERARGARWLGTGLAATARLRRWIEGVMKAVEAFVGDGYGRSAWARS